MSGGPGRDVDGPAHDAGEPPAALILARAPSDPGVNTGLAALLAPPRRATLQALLIRRAVAWATAVAPRSTFVAVVPAGAVDEVAALLPAAVTAFAQEAAHPAGVLAAAIERIGRGPLLIAGVDCPRVSSDHLAAVLDDLASGCDVSIGPTLDGGWYLAGLREPRPELLTVAPEAWRRGGGFALALRHARELGAAIGMLRHERLLVTPDDAAALLADPLLPADLRAALG